MNVKHVAIAVHLSEDDWTAAVKFRKEFGRKSAPKAKRNYTRKAKASQPAAEAAPAKVKRAAKAGNGGAELSPKFPKPGAKRRGRPPGAKNKATMLPVEPAAPVAQA